MLDRKALLLTGLLFGGCIAGPFVLSLIQPWLGVAGCAVSFCVWIAQVPTGPGMLQGLVCLCGLGGIVGAGLAALSVALR